MIFCAYLKLIYKFIILPTSCKNVMRNSTKRNPKYIKKIYIILLLFEPKRENIKRIKNIDEIKHEKLQYIKSCEQNCFYHILNYLFHYKTKKIHLHDYLRFSDA